MRLATITRLAFLFVILMSAGCSSNNKGKIEGTKWTNQATTVKGQELPAGLMIMEFTQDGTIIQTFLDPATKRQFQQVTGKYVLGMGDVITFNMNEAVGGHKKLQSKFTITGNTLLMKDADGTSITFNKS